MTRLRASLSLRSLSHPRPSLLLAVFAAFALGGCANEVSLDEHDQDHGAVFVGQEESLDRQLEEQDGWKLSPVLATEALANRAGIRFDADGPVEMHARTSLDGGATFGAWRPVEVTFVEGVAHNAHVDLEPEASHVQLRFVSAVESKVRFLAVELFAYVAPVDGPNGIDLDEAAESEQGLAADGVAVARSEWGARPSRCSSTHAPERMTVHHTVTPNHDGLSMAARLRQIQSYHMDTRGWCDLGYHFLVGQDGQVYQGRSEELVGAHAAGANTDNAGVSFIGNFSDVAPSQAMLEAGARALRALSDAYGIELDREHVKGHREVGSTDTSCPGGHLFARLEELLDEARGQAAIGTAAASATPSEAHASGSYADLSPEHEAFAAAEALRRAGALWGCAQDHFCPDVPLTRAELAYALAHLDGASFRAPSSPTFVDVPTSHWGYESIEEVAASGVLPGCTDVSFCPDDMLSRAYGAVVVRWARGLDWLIPASPSFVDVPLSHWASGAIERMFADGLMSGCTLDAFCPAAALTRGDAAVLLAGAYGL